MVSAPRDPAWWHVLPSGDGWVVARGRRVAARFRAGCDRQAQAYADRLNHKDLPR